jgi:hypothetical protein
VSDDANDYGRMFPCLGSGYCCLKAQCVASVRLHGVQERCPELQWDGTRYLCGLMLGEEGEYYRRDLYAGAGCSSPLSGWRQDVRFRG